MNDVAALYIDPNGPYSSIPGVDCWDEKRDARLYDGPHPVVAHPPCQLWVNFAHLNFSRWGGEHNRPGNDGGYFEHALMCVRKFGGVIEHPADSHAWRAFGLQDPDLSGGWQRDMFSSDYVCEVWQSAYGHKARKRTWLLYNGKSRPADANWSRLPGTHQIGGFDITKPVLAKSQTHLTPPLFADYLVALARGSN